LCCYHLVVHDLQAIRRLVSETPLTTVEQLASGELLHHGPIALHGHAVPLREPIQSPISGVPVVGYRIQFSELGLMNRVKSSFAVRQVAPFAVKIGSWQIEVSGDAYCHLYLTHEYRGTPQDVGSGAQAAYKIYMQHARAPKGRRRSWHDRISWHEYYLEPNEQVYLCGWLKEEFDISRREGYRSHTSRPLICGTENHPLIIADYDRATLLAKMASRTA
jgi:hypothetical protein